MFSARTSWYVTVLVLGDTQWTNVIAGCDDTHPDPEAVNTSFLMHLSAKSIFLHYKNDSTVTFIDK